MRAISKPEEIAYLHALDIQFYLEH
jgi:hypothetical protein